MSILLNKPICNYVTTLKIFKMAAFMGTILNYTRAIGEVIRHEEYKRKLW